MPPVPPLAEFNVKVLATSVIVPVLENRPPPKAFLPFVPLAPGDAPLPPIPPTALLLVTAAL